MFVVLVLERSDIPVGVVPRLWGVLWWSVCLKSRVEKVEGKYLVWFLQGPACQGVESSVLPDGDFKNLCQGPVATGKRCFKCLHVMPRGPVTDVDLICSIVCMVMFGVKGVEGQY